MCPELLFIYLFAYNSKYQHNTFFSNILIFLAKYHWISLVVIADGLAVLERIKSSKMPAAAITSKIMCLITGRNKQSPGHMV